MDSSIYKTAETVTALEQLDYEVKSARESRESQAQVDRAEEFSTEFDQQSPEAYSAPLRGKGQSRKEYAQYAQAHREHYTTQRDAKRQGYVAQRAKQVSAQVSEEERTNVMNQLKIIEAEASTNPMQQQNLNAIKNFQASNYAHMSVPDYMALLTSKDQSVRAQALAMQSRGEVMGSFNEASLADKETMRMKEAPQIIVPKYSKAELDADPTLKAQNEIIAEGKATDFGGDFSREGLLRAREEFKKSGVDIAMNPDLASQAYVESKYKQIGKEMSDDPVQASSDTTGKMALMNKAISMEVVKSFKLHANSQDQSFVSRNDTILTEALGNAGVDPESMEQYEYQNAVKGAYSMILSLRDASFNNAATANMFNTKQGQADAYEFVAGKLHDFTIQTNTNPEMIADAMQKSQGTSDTFTAISMVGAEGRMDVINQIDMGDFKQSWSKLPLAQQQTSFNDKVFDVLMDSTRNMRPDKQKHAMSVIRKLRTKSAMGQLGTAEPMIAQEMNTMFGMFANSKGVEWNAESMERQAQMQSGVLVHQVGEEEHTVTFEPNTKNGDDNRDAYINIVNQNPSAPQIAQRMGMMSTDGRMPLNADDLSILGKMSTAYSNGLLGNETFARMEQLGKTEDVKTVNTLLNNISEGDRARDFDALASMQGGVTADQARIDSIFGSGDDLAGRIGTMIKTNTRLATAWKNGDPKIRQSALITALDMTQKAPTQISDSRRKEFLADIGQNNVTMRTATTNLIDDMNVTVTSAEEGNYSQDEIKEGLADIWKQQESHEQYEREIDAQAKDQEKTFGWVDEDLQGIQAQMSEYGAVLLKYENDLQRLTRTPAEQQAQVTSFRQEVGGLVSANPWLKHNETELVRLDVMGRGREGTSERSRFQYYIVPKGQNIERVERGRQIPPDNSIIIGGMTPSKARQYYADVNESLFEFNPNGE